MYNSNFLEIFPTKWSSIIFILYITLFISQGLLVTSSQESTNVYNYNVVLVVSFTEMIKLLLCIIIYCVKNNFYSIFDQTARHIKLLWLYFIPAFLYCLYNYFSFINLLNYDPATYYILLQLRVVLTGILFQILFKKTLTLTQWLSLILLTVGCMFKNLNFERNITSTDHNTLSSIQYNSSTSRLHKSDGMGLNYNTILILLQILCSCFAGVYSEYLLKKDGLHVDIFIQNIFMYLNSIVCNVLMLFWQWDFMFFSNESLNKILNYKVLLVILNNAAVGIVTSFFLKHLNSILKTVASALELTFITIFSWLFFNFPINTNTIVSVLIVSFSIFLYSRNPVQNSIAHTTVGKKELMQTNA